DQEVQRGPTGGERPSTVPEAALRGWRAAAADPALLLPTVPADRDLGGPVEPGKERLEATRVPAPDDDQVRHHASIPRPTLSGVALGHQTGQNSRLRRTPDGYTASWGLGSDPLEAPPEAADGDLVEPAGRPPADRRFSDRPEAEALHPAPGHRGGRPDGD